MKASSVAKPTMPRASSRTRSRRAFSRSSSSPPKPVSSAGSAISRSAPLATSSAHRQVTGSVPPRDRRKATVPPSGETWNERGAPRVK